MASRAKTIAASTNPILTQFATGYSGKRGFIGRLVAPVIESLTETGSIFGFGKEGFKIYNTERAPRTNANKVDFAISSDTYACAEHALGTELDKKKEIEQAKKYGAAQVLKLEQRAVTFVQDLIERELEKSIADIILGATYYATGNKTTLTGTDQWSDVDNSDPIGDIETGIDAAQADMGVEPNTLVMGYQAFRTLKNHPAITEKIKYSMKAKVTPELLADLLDFEKIFVGRSIYSTDAGVFTRLWGDSVALIYTPSKDELVEGTTPHTVVIEEKGYPVVETFDREKTVGYEVTRSYQVKNISTSNGYLISDVAA
jgi:hypothetical protein